MPFRKGLPLKVTIDTPAYPDYNWANSAPTIWLLDASTECLFSVLFGVIGLWHLSLAVIFRPQQRSTGSSAASTTVAPGSTGILISTPDQI